jgi:membrane-bound lytic murein transglycosylase B
MPPHSLRALGRALRYCASAGTCLALLAFALLQPANEARADTAYERFIRSFWASARKAGISRKTYDAAFAGLSPDPEVLEKNAYQPEFKLPPSQYVVAAVTDTRVRIGKEMLEKYNSELDAIEKKWGVDRHVLLAIWGMETNFGTFMGKKNVIRSLSTLGYRGRRAKFGRQQLIAALRMMERGVVPEGPMLGSWAGAMGHTQLIPVNYLKFAVDLNGDGKRDIWSPVEALASSANFLSRQGWDTGKTWGYEVSLPRRVGKGYEGRRRSRSLAKWAALGVKRVNGGAFPRPGDRAYLYLPMGTKGPAFLLLDNFRTIMRYNAAHTYALSVGHLADRIGGGEAFVTPWPDGARALTEDERFEIQKRLIARGHEIGDVDGVLGSKTRAAIRALQKEKGVEVDGFPTPKILEMLRADGKPVQ